MKSLPPPNTCHFWGHCRWYLLKFDDTVWASNSRSLVLILVLADHRGRLGGTSSYSEGLGFCSRLRSAVPRGVLRFYCVPSSELWYQRLRFLIYWRLLSCGMWFIYTDVVGILLPSPLRQNTGRSISRRLLYQWWTILWTREPNHNKNMFAGHIVNHT